jgi:cation diffusion facilitator family transporter
MVAQVNQKHAVLEAKQGPAIISLVVGVCLSFVKMWAWYATGSSAVMSDALESLINVATAIMAIGAIWVSTRPADGTHPYGHGKIEFFSSGAEGALIFLAGFAIVIHAVQALIWGTQLDNMDVGLLLVAGAGVVNLFLGLYLLRSGKKSHSEALIANGHHILSDAWTSGGIIIGIGLVIITGLDWLDPLFAILVGLWILRSGYQIVRRSVGMLMDEADPDLLDRITVAVVKSRRPGWIAPHRLRAWRSGSLVRIDFHLIMPFYWTLEQTHEEEHAIHDALHELLEEPSEVIVHTEPCFTACCNFCGIQECHFRKEPQRRSFDWHTALLEAELVSQTAGVSHPDHVTHTHDEEDSP